MLKSKIIRLSTISLFGLVLGACATTAKFESRMDAKKGLNKEQLIDVMGIPDREYKTGSFEIVEYNQSRTVSETKSDSTVVNGYVINTNSSVPYTMSCRLEFKLVDGVVESYRYKGDMCRSR
ncbi:hypothetical protein [Acinetobacter indicus]|uniref:hypothetical protein n=1 Tax=Acinetobacter indicus TaxID=756892 RepID=UPI0012E31582|nr:hypothetical protein [Acinetobacter indicus]MDM1330032.1 hypothetical protein [Acinetobacter indicus]